MAARIWILGSSDPEMELIEQLLRECGETVVYATDSRGERVRGGTAYRGAHAEIPADAKRVYLVECDVPTPPGVERVVIDHHRPGDPGYGKGPGRFFEASSIGQVIRHLGQVADDMPREYILAAAADHCLAAAYRGECPGVDPDELMRWRAESRARFQRRSVDDVLADIERARQALRKALDITLRRTPGGHCGDGSRCGCLEGGYGYGGWTGTGTGDCYCDCSGCEEGDYVVRARDMRGRHVPELPEAAAREGVCFIADGLPDPDGRIKIVCQNGTPEQIEAFREWAEHRGLVDFYGDPARGIAGAYEITAPAKA